MVKRTLVESLRSAAKILGSKGGKKRAANISQRRIESIAAQGGRAKSARAR